ncbi:DUF262 domain-containing protein [Micromonospora sp. WMMD1102]|uniref:DUF262 domain-containing protein n=1 Tax=Micromonospora sp. WMMD1102 TaxID=3016105 RepID=UPI002414DD77|nr:DUF262 domain-containing protein [Micromonospora sp. WMMD1102]MDG4791048.1 DUF262 domain-containing protein [Micromonospora sp. WMMD1102]MDG4792260.1 DUF262 domain-containing protein [Micromonospora sp. WMMD1102]
MAIDHSVLQAELAEHRQAVDVDFFDLSLRELARMVEEREVRIAPEFQRQFRWNDQLQSALVESFLLGLPVPAIFVATNGDGTWEVVDGLQRICTLLRFMAIDAPESDLLHFSQRPLRLTGLKTLEGFQGVSYEDLPRPIKLMFERRYLRIQVLSDKSDLDVRFELFRRLNQGAVELSGQEVRACVYRGTLNTLVENLAEYEPYTRLLKLKEVDKRNGTAAEMVLKFFAYLDDVESFQGSVTGFLNEYMKKHTNITDTEARRQEFHKCVDFLGAIVNGPFLRSGTKVTPLNHLEAVLVGIARVFRAGKVPIRPEGDWLNDPEMLEFVRTGTNARRSVIGRVNRAEELFSPR